MLFASAACPDISVDDLRKLSMGFFASGIPDLENFNMTVQEVSSAYGMLSTPYDEGFSGFDIFEKGISSSVLMRQVQKYEKSIPMKNFFNKLKNRFRK